MCAVHPEMTDFPQRSPWNQRPEETNALLSTYVYYADIFQNVSTVVEKKVQKVHTAQHFPRLFQFTPTITYQIILRISKRFAR
jgi:hypothetical protein